MNPLSTDIDRNFKELDDHPEFTRRFLRDIILLPILSALAVILVLTVICNAEEIDKFFFGLISDLAYGINKKTLYYLISISFWLSIAWIWAVWNAKNTMLHSIRWGGRSFIR